MTRQERRKAALLAQAQPAVNDSHADPKDTSRREQKRDVSGDIHVRGEIEVKVPIEVEQKEDAREKQRDARDGKRFAVEIATLIIVIIYAGLTAVQSCQAVRSADATREANRITKENFRTDQRPYLVQAPSWTPSQLLIVPTGEHAGEIRFSLLMENVGKSPAIVTSQFLHLYLGDREIATVGTDEIPEHRNPPPIVSAGDKPTFYVYSKRLSQPEIDSINADITATKIMHVPAVIYGHIEYTDIFPSPKPSYGFSTCASLSPDPYTDQQTEGCKNRTFIR
jgi:hypothetical protein